MEPSEPSLHRLTTEQPNPATAFIDTLPTIDVLRLMNDEDRRVPEAVGQELPAIADAVDGIAARLRTGGHLFYVGAGTSGRLGILDAAECPPTFSTPPTLVQALIAGGPSAVTRSAEGAEDDADGGARDIRNAGASASDAVVGLSASGRAPYVLGALDAARFSG